MCSVRLYESVLLLLVIFCISQGQCEENLPYDTVVCFGDSMSDTGNVYNLTSSQWPPSPYYQGHFSNGPMWIEKLNITNLINYAYGSATSDNNLVVGSTAFNTIVPDIRQQIAMYKNRTNLTNINFLRTIYVIWADGNDYYYNATVSPSIVVNSLMNSVKDLIAIGSKNILILNQTPLQAFPILLYSNMTDYLTTITNSHNSNLASSIQILQSNFTNISLKLFDVASLITNILQNSSAYGINSTTNCWSILTGTVTSPCSTPDTYLFIDEYHFTTHVHQIIADHVRKFLQTSNRSVRIFPSLILFLYSLLSLIK